ncbi:MAG: nicotinamide riboside transporter PnuC [Cytophagales bacterium]|nr:nicotinamide riboside transporter PnuC [Cytophagales bacterium]
MRQYLEIAGSFTGIVCIYYNMRANIWGWAWGIVSIIIYAYIFYTLKLYADFGLQIIFLFVSIYGIYQWLHGNKENIIIVSKNTPIQNIISILFTVLIFFLICYLLQKYTDARSPLLDSFNTSLCITAQILLARKKVENWLFWIIADVLYTYLYICQTLYITAAFYSIITIMAVLGYIQWNKMYKTHNIDN